MNTHDAVHLDTPPPVAMVDAVFFLTIGLVFFGAAIVGAMAGRGGRGRDSSGVRGIFVRGPFSRSPPAGNLPQDAGEALEPEAASFPFAARFAGSIEGSKASVDGSLVGFGT